jgi:hypothetical protein
LATDLASQSLVVVSSRFLRRWEIDGMGARVHDSRDKRLWKAPWGRGGDAFLEKAGTEGRNAKILDSASLIQYALPLQLKLEDCDPVIAFSASCT